MLLTDKLFSNYRIDFKILKAFAYFFGQYESCKEPHCPQQSLLFSIIEPIMLVMFIDWPWWPVNDKTLSSHLALTLWVGNLLSHIVRCATLLWSFNVSATYSSAYLASDNATLLFGILYISPTAIFFLILVVSIKIDSNLPSSNIVKSLRSSNWIRCRLDDSLYLHTLLLLCSNERHISSKLSNSLFQYICMYLDERCISFNCVHNEKGGAIRFGLPVYITIAVATTATPHLMASDVNWICLLSDMMWLVWWLNIKHLQ